MKSARNPVAFGAWMFITFACHEAPPKPDITPKPAPTPTVEAPRTGAAGWVRSPTNETEARVVTYVGRESTVRFVASKETACVALQVRAVGDPDPPAPTQESPLGLLGCAFGEGASEEVQSRLAKTAAPTWSRDGHVVTATTHTTGAPLSIVHAVIVYPPGATSRYSAPIALVNNDLVRLMRCADVSCEDVGRVEDAVRKIPGVRATAAFFGAQKPGEIAVFVTGDGLDDIAVNRVAQKATNGRWTTRVYMRPSLPDPVGATELWDLMADSLKSVKR